MFYGSSRKRLYFITVVDSDPSSTTDDHYSTIEPYRDDTDEELNISNTMPTCHQQEQPSDALLGDINELPLVTVRRIVAEDGRLIEIVELSARHHGVYQETHQLQQQRLTAEYDVLRH